VTARVLLPGRAAPTVITASPWPARQPPPRSRRALAAPHVAAGPDGGIDWQATLEFRNFLWDYGFGVADAMDTAQRGAGLTWDLARELIRQSATAAAARGALIACGAGTDQLPDGPHPLAAITRAYEEQLAVVQAAGAQVILMASRALAASARSARDYLEVYGSLLKQVDRPVILHWLGEAFDPKLRGYWGSADFAAAADTVLDLLAAADGRVDGIKLSVLDDGAEVSLRQRLPPGVRLYTGDDLHYDTLIKGGPAVPGGAGPHHPEGLAYPGDFRGHSDALLGAFSAVTAPAAAALAALDRGDEDGYDAAIGPTMPVSRLLFEPPTSRYKAGIAFLAWLNGLQPYFAMLGGFQRQRPASHLIAVFELAAEAGVFRDPDLAAARMTAFLAGPPQ